MLKKSLKTRKKEKKQTIMKVLLSNFGILVVLLICQVIAEEEPDKPKARSPLLDGILGGGGGGGGDGLLAPVTGLLETVLGLLTGLLGGLGK